MLQLPRPQPLPDYGVGPPAGGASGRVRARAGGRPPGPGAETVLLTRCASALQREVVPTAA